MTGDLAAEMAKRIPDDIAVYKSKSAVRAAPSEIGHPGHPRCVLYRWA
jgi:hypothetical protein